MIDWITAVIPWRHPAGVHDGQVMSIDRAGNVEWSSPKRLAVRGSYESTLHIRSDTRSIDFENGDHLNMILDGNPVKFFQGHNLWGTNDLVGLMAETCLKVAEVINLPIPDLDWLLIENGMYHLKRVDSTAMLDIGNNASVESFLYSLERTGHMRYKGQGIMTKGTIYFGKHSRRESLKFYNKLTEIMAKGHRLPAELEALPHLIEWVTGKLRAEHTLRSMQLKQIGLDIAGNWGENKPLEVLTAAMSGLNMSEQHTLTPSALDGLPPRLVGIYHLWKEGHDLRAMYPSTTFKRYRKQLQEMAGIDIAVKQGNRQEPAPNVIDFRRVLTPTLVTEVPAWAVGTPLYFEPRAKIAR